MPILDHVGETTQNDTLILPILQAGQFGIREEERALDLLFRELSAQNGSASDGPLMDLTSGYFGIYQRYCDLILRSRIGCRIVAASPKVRSIVALSLPGIEIACRLMDSMAHEEFLVAYLRVIPCWNSVLCVLCEMLSGSPAHTKLESSCKSGNERDGLITPRVCHFDFVSCARPHQHD